MMDYEITELCYDAGTGTPTYTTPGAKITELPVISQGYVVETPRSKTCLLIPTNRVYSVRFRMIEDEPK